VNKRNWRSAAGQIGGKAAAAAMTPEERSERARAAVQARWQAKSADPGAPKELHAALDRLLDIVLQGRAPTPAEREAIRKIAGIVRRARRGEGK
jgi:hypothetical protein